MAGRAPTKKGSPIFQGEPLRYSVLGKPLRVLPLRNEASVALHLTIVKALNSGKGEDIEACALDCLADRSRIVIAVDSYYALINIHGFLLLSGVGVCFPLDNYYYILPTEFCQLFF